MREATGSTWIFSLVITFTLIFSGFLVLALTYSKTYKMKNEMTTMIEKYEGITITDDLNNLGSLNIINMYLYNNGYKSTGNCSLGEYGVDDLTSENQLTYITDSNIKNKYYYCISYVQSPNECAFIFKLRVFFDFNLPVFGQLRKYSISGHTNEIRNAYWLTSQIKCESTK